ncbi:hypothetical protein D9M68_672090 [compost metagenome]
MPDGFQATEVFKLFGSINFGRHANANIVFARPPETVNCIPRYTIRTEEATLTNSLKIPLFIIICAGIKIKVVKEVKTHVNRNAMRKAISKSL